MKIVYDKRLIAGLILLLAGCASPAYRIKKNPEVFASFPPEVQEKVREGKIEVGYTRDMALIALGPPSRIYARETAAGTTEIWSYENYRYTTDFVPIHTTYWYHDAEGRLRLGHDWAWADVEQRMAEDALRVEFSGDKVTAIETLAQP